MKALRRTSFYLTALTAALTILPAQAADISPTLKKNADILQTILQTAFKEDENSRLSSMQYSYLTGQGLLFQANAVRSGRHVFHFSGSGVAPVAPIPPVPPLPEGDFEFEIDTDEIERLTEAAQEMAEQVKQQHRYTYRIAEKQRAIERELRDVERDLRDIEFNKSMSKLDKEQQQELATLQQKAKVLKEKQAEVEKEAATSRKQLEEQRSKQLAEQQKQTAAMVKTVGEKFSQILCDYGASLRDMPDTEYVSLQVNNRGSDGRYYWVVRKSDINQCMTGKIKAKDLLTKASTYQF
ncbi:hypothetical protein [Rheinheimera aquimaris]|uniref:hypothetical protein n=1 Tax=Rheinheimera aquimaris TaxID=412437 RepID=UPI001E43A0B4|nr:hypothetical protein [Rheinheimera aquimaris]MCD1597512.1 hypothetical protein [Rheinheimera aquimaris]